MRKDREYNDGFTHKGMRKILVDTLRDKGITDESVLDAINTVPRHFFLESAFEKIAYENRAFPYFCRPNNFSSLYGSLPNSIATNKKRG
jgi:protein-L-isoaspartate(D-aspartate) O-methyltransferase